MVKVKTRTEGQNSFSRPRAARPPLSFSRSILFQIPHIFCFCQDLDFVDSLSKQIFKACWTFIDFWNQRLCFEVQFYFHCEIIKSFEQAIFFVWNRVRRRTGWVWLASALSVQSADALKIPLMHEDTWMKYPNPGMPSLWPTLSHIKTIISELILP